MADSCTDDVIKGMVERLHLNYGILWKEEVGLASFGAAYMDGEAEKALRQAGKHTFLDVSRDLHFGRGDGSVGRVLTTGRYEWIPNVQVLPPEAFSRHKAAKDSRIKSIIWIAVHGGILELGSLLVLKEDPKLIEVVRNQLRLGPSSHYQTRRPPRTR